MFCANCGNKLLENAKFCNKCGAKITEKISYSNQNSVDVRNSDIADSKGKRILKFSLGFVISIFAVCILTGYLYLGDFSYYVIGSINNFINGKPSTTEINLDSPGSDIKKISSEPAIEITNLDFYSLYGIITAEIDFKNISDKDIAYVEFEIYCYDRMGTLLDKGFDNYYITSQYTGPLYKGGNDTFNTDLGMDSRIAVVYPKLIKVTFFDDSSVTFENDIFVASNDFYGGDLKD